MPRDSPSLVDLVALEALAMAVDLAMGWAMAMGWEAWAATVEGVATSAKHPQHHS